MLRTKPASMWSLAWCALVPAMMGCGPRELVVVALLGMDKHCEYTPDTAHALSEGEYDIAPGVGNGCDEPYRAHFLVQNDNDGIVSVTWAQVQLHGQQHQTISFDRVRPVLPNPFTVDSSGPIPSGRGVVVVQVLPRAYASQLDGFVGKSLMASVILNGKSADSDPVSSNTFRLTIQICDGCKTICASNPDNASVNAACDGKNPGVERPFCIDDGC